MHSTFIYLSSLVPPGAILLQRNQSIGEIRKIGMDYSVSFDLTVNVIYESVKYFLHIMKGTNTNVITVSSITSSLHVTTPHNELIAMGNLKHNQWMNIKISQRNTNNGYKIAIYVNHVKITEQNNGNPSVYEYLKVFACGEGSPQIGMIHNLYINGKSYIVCCTNIFPFVPF